MDQNKPLNIDELNRLYSDGERVDSTIFAEQRSNIQLSSGEHYTRKNFKWWDRIRVYRDIPDDAKLRLTKNHVHKIVNTYVNNIVNHAPWVVPTPNNPKELQDQKAAELNKAVWEYAKQKHHLKTKIQGWAKDFVEVGECLAKIYWDPQAGDFIGWEQEVDAAGQPVFDENGQPAKSNRAVFSGDLVFKRIYGFNVIRPSDAKTMHDARWLCLREMIDVKDLKALIKDPEKAKKIVATPDETFFVFDGGKGLYHKAENQALLKEFYFRPCSQYPEGYFFITCANEILFEGPLPYGVFPIIYEGWDEIQTTPRHRSIIKQLRPYQAEINRAGSQQATHQVTLGDDKVILQNGAKVTTGPHLPGVRTMFVTGQAPTILEGRSGAQFVEYINSQISEMYSVAQLAEDGEEKELGADPLANLYRSMRDKKKFSIYAEKFEGFLKNVCFTYLELAKQYFDENMLIPKIGASEYINIPEFKSQEKLCYQIKIEPLSDDINTMMGRHIVLNHVLQYVGQNLDKDTLGMLIRQMPFANAEDSFSDLTTDYDMATNIILALDRGQMVAPTKQDNGPYILKRLAARQKQADYQFLAPQIRLMYDQLMQQYEMLEAEKAAAIKAAQNEFIPSGGALLAVDYYVPDPNNKTRTIRARLPAEAIDWLIKRLQEQGSSQDVLQQLGTGTQSEIARMLLQQNGQPNQGGMVQPSPVGLPPRGILQ